MSPVTAKMEYRSPSDNLQEEIAHLGLPKEHVAHVVTPSTIVGTWVNVDHATRDIVRLVIEPNGNEITVHGFGACVPNPCDWGKTKGMIYSASVATTPAVAFTAAYNFGFKQTTLTGHLYNGALFVESFNHFTDDSGRDDYFTLDIMSK